jgi:hypothetical protein
MLKSLGAIAPTDLQTLRSFLEEAHDAKNLLAGLDDNRLLALARNFRIAEEAFDDGRDESISNLVAPQALLYLLGKVDDDEEHESAVTYHFRMGEALSVRIVQRAIEREVVTRILSAESPNTDGGLAQALKEEVGLLKEAVREASLVKRAEAARKKELRDAKNAGRNSPWGDLAARIRELQEPL